MTHTVHRCRTGIRLRVVVASLKCSTYLIIASHSLVTRDPPSASETYCTLQISRHTGTVPSQIRWTAVDVVQP